MKKILAVLAALSMLMAMASCGGDKDTTSSTNTSSTNSVSSTASVSSSDASSQVVSVESIVIPDVVDTNLAHAEGATYVDMNTGKTAEDEGYIAYYNATVTLEHAFDGNNTTGWQTVENYGGDEAAVTEEEVNASEDPSLYWHSTLDTNKWFLKPTYEDETMWLGVTFEEAVAANLIKIDWESGSVPPTVEEGGYYFQYTEDGTEWKDLEVTVTRDTETLENHAYDTAEFETVEAKGFRCVVLKASTKFAPKVWEMEIYAPEEAADEGTTAE